MQTLKTVKANLKSNGASNVEMDVDGIRCIMNFNRQQYSILISWGESWEHVSVSNLRKPKECPTWEAMCFFKDTFWQGHEAVMQLHPPRADYINYHPGCLHLWKPLDAEIPLPPSKLVGY